jgi:thymidylate kinase
MTIKHYTILGIDGSGKTTLINKLMKSSPVPLESVSFITAPNYHEGIDAPFLHLSRDLEKFSSICDELASFELKGISLYLQATLFGVVENFLRTHWKPSMILSQRHPVLDSLVYGDLYVKMIKSSINRDLLENKLKELLQSKNIAFEKIERWFHIHCQRLSINSSFWDFPLEIKRIFSQSWEQLCITLMTHYQTSMPTGIIYIHVDPSVALQKIEGRSDTTDTKKELHETAQGMKILQDNYEKMLTFIEQNYPKIKVIRLEAYGELPMNFWDQF